MAEHLEQISHDKINRYFKNEKLTPRILWDNVKDLIEINDNAYLVFDDTVIDKRYAIKIEPSKRQYSGNEHGLVKGIGVVNLIHSNGQRDFNPIDYRIYAAATDGKTKNQHFRAMVLKAVADKQIQARTVLFDSGMAQRTISSCCSGWDSSFTPRSKPTVW